MREVESADSEAETQYITNFHLIKVYQNFVRYWWMYAYTKMVEWIEVNSHTFNTSDLRSEFFKEGDEPQTPTEVSHMIEITDNVTKEVVPDAIAPFAPSLPPHV